MARDVEQGARRPRERTTASEEYSAYASSSRGSSDGEGQGSRGEARKASEASELSTTAAPPSSTFSAALFRWFATAAPPPPTKPYDALDSNASFAVHFDDDDDDEEEDDEETGVETVASVRRRLGAAAASARRDLLRSNRRRRLLLLPLLLCVAAALAAAVSSPWWLSERLLKPPRTHELPFVFVEAGAAESGSAPSSSSPAPSPPREIVPRVIHQSWKTHSTPPKWDAARKSCSDLHPRERGWSVRLWDDSELREAVAEAAFKLGGGSPDSPVARELLRAYDAYPNPVQRADISRYAVLFLHGGVYLDLDVRCERPLDAPELSLLEKEVVLPRTWPAGISNDVVVAAPGSGLLELALRSAAGARRWSSALLFASGYARVMFSTGPMFLTVTALRWPERGEKLWIMPARLYGKYREKEQGKKKEKKAKKKERKAKKEENPGRGGGEESASAATAVAAGCENGEGREKGSSNRLHGAGAPCGALFTHLHGSSWHGKDAALLAWVRRKKEGKLGAAALGVSAAAAALAAVLVSAAVVRKRRRRQKERQQQEQQQQQQLLQMQQRRPPASSQQQQQQQQRPLGLFANKKWPLVPASSTPSLSKQH